MRYEVRLVLEVDEEAPWLEIGDTTNCDTLEDLLRDLIYDLDDITIRSIEVDTA